MIFSFKITFYISRNAFYVDNNQTKKLYAENILSPLL